MALIHEEVRHRLGVGSERECQVLGGALGEQPFDLAASLGAVITRRRLLQGSAAVLLQAAVAPFAPASAVRKRSTDKSAAEATPYSPAFLPTGIRSRFVQNINGLRMHVLEAGFEVKDRPCVVLLHGFPELAYSWRRKGVLLDMTDSILETRVTSLYSVRFMPQSASFRTRTSIPCSVASCDAMTSFWLGLMWSWAFVMR